MRRSTELIAGMIAAMLLVAVGASAMAQPATPVATTIEADLELASTWLMDQQTDDGSFPGFSGEGDPGTTVDAVLALVAAGTRGIDTAGAVASAIEYLESEGAAQAYAETGPGQAAKLALVTVATGGDPHDVAGVDALAMVSEAQDGDTGLFGVSVFDHALALMALSAADSDVPESALTALESTQTPDGGWAFDGTTEEGAADTNTTAMVLQALAAIDAAEPPMAQDALDYLGTAIDGDAGAVYQPGAGQPADSSSTAVVMQALLAMGEDPASDEWGNMPAALAGFQSESGAFHYNADDTSDNLFATVQSIPAAAGEPFPIVPAESAALVDTMAMIGAGGSGIARAA